MNTIKAHQGFERKEIIGLYRKRARSYDITANLYYLLGYREGAYRREAVEALGLKKGDVVVDICCGTGLNFPFIQKAISLDGEIGLDGKIIGVDLTNAMLEQAKVRINKNNWENVELVQGDASKYKFPENINGVITTYALSLIPDYDKVVKNAYDALVPGGRFVDMSVKTPTKGFLSHLKSIIFPLIRPFGDPEKYMDVRTWESIEEHFDKHEFKEYFGGIGYLSIGEKGGGING